jgi:type IV pilus biogenesis protein CpaD/CtpE
MNMITVDQETLMRMIAQAVEAEREACAKVAEDSDHVVGGRGYYDQLGDADATVRNIAAAIRNRGNT